jgi:hypothetical protein
MIEAANKQLKYRLLYYHHIADYDTLVKFVEQSVNEYNNRPHHVLHGLTPTEVLQGKYPIHMPTLSNLNNQKQTDSSKTKKSSAAIIVSDIQHLVYKNCDLL